MLCVCVCVCVLVPQSCPVLCDRMDCSPTRLLCPWDFPEWVAIAFSRGSAQPRIEPRSLALLADSLISEPPGKQTLCRKSNCLETTRLKTPCLGTPIDSPLQAQSFSHSSFQTFEFSCWDPLEQPSHQLSPVEWQQHLPKEKKSYSHILTRNSWPTESMRYNQAVVLNH